MKSVDYLFITITPKSVMPRVVAPITREIDLLKNYMYSIGPSSKTTLNKQLYNKCKQELVMNAIPELLGIEYLETG